MAHVNFVPASDAHLQEIADDITRIRTRGATFRSATEEGVYRELKSTAQGSGSGLGIGFQPDGPSSTRVPYSDQRRRARDEGVDATQLTVKLMLFPHPDTVHLVEMLQVDRLDNAVAFFVPTKWAFIHVVIVPLLPYKRSDLYPASWSELYSATTPQQQEIILRDVETLRQRVVAQFSVGRTCSAWLSDESRVVRALKNAHCNDPGSSTCRWQGCREQQQFFSVLYKKKEQAYVRQLAKSGAPMPSPKAVLDSLDVVVPLRVGVFMTPVANTFDVPVVHVLSGDVMYCHERAIMWNAVFCKEHFVEFSGSTKIAGATSAPFAAPLPTGGQLLATRKKLMNANDLTCPGCQLVASLPELTAHWRDTCLPGLVKVLREGTPMLL